MSRYGNRKEPIIQLRGMSLCTLYVYSLSNAKQQKNRHQCPNKGINLVSLVIRIVRSN